jgi:cytosine/adenosine deaminase-related metal-dependent hydrolase
MDLVVRGGVVVTMDADRAVRRADVVVRDGAIAEVAHASGGARAARVLDATGCAVIPGLVQAHVHLCQALFRGMADDLPLLEWLRERIWPLEGAHDERSLAASARLGLAEMILAGTTTILDMGTVHHHDVVFEAMRESGIRGFSGKAMMDHGHGVPKGLREKTRESLREAERLCQEWNGADGGRLGYAFAPRFVLSCSERLMRETAEMARALGALLHSHVAEHADERAAVRDALGMDDVEALAEYGLRGPTCLLAHAVQLRKDEMRRMAKDGTRVAHCPSANLKLASGIADVRAMRDAGIVVGLGADGAPCNNRMDPWTELRQAALLAKVKRASAAALPAIEALELATIDGARALGIDDRGGSIEPGKRADIVVVSLDGMHAEPPTDPVATLVYATTATDVRHVVVDGRVVVKDRELLTLDADSVRAGARAEAKRVAARARV